MTKLKVIFLANRKNWWMEGHLLRPFGDDISTTDEVISAAELSRYDVGISYGYRHILKKPQIDAVKYGIYNCHIAPLPDGRGAMPNVWGIIDKWGAGVTIHKIDEGIDTGSIVAQRRVWVYPTDTGKSLYDRLTTEMLSLLEGEWPRIRLRVYTGADTYRSQPPTNTPTYKVKDAEWADDLESRFGDTAWEFVNTLRARTFPPYKGCFVRDVLGRKVYLKLELYYAEE